ncbi:hypothetical protein COR50_09585 [Chitinophaga caeni]|uniref:DUF1440 domain-containing protein n=1 Tax=Chitinophaga caeni TaxID=2029983 RepID=A0A291QU09_9BACT|nr:hypothetical protein COR50_09585 [Chitinophaga caeni]
MNTSPKKHYAKTLRTIIIATLVTGTLDGIAACLMYIIRTGRWDVQPIFVYIASGVYGNDAFEARDIMLWRGILFHYLVAFIFCLVLVPSYRLIFKVLPNQFLVGLVYGLLIYGTMNFVVLPLSNASIRPFEWGGAILSSLILILCVGLPISLLAQKRLVINA